MTTPLFEEVEHTADWALLVRGVTIESLFENAAQGMLSLIHPKFQDTDPEDQFLELSALDLETLLVSWLEELLYLLESKRTGFQDVSVKLKDTFLQASFKTLPIQSIKKDIKAVTYNELEIVADQQGFHTTIVFDV